MPMSDYDSYDDWVQSNWGNSHVETTSERISREQREQEALKELEDDDTPYQPWPTTKKQEYIRPQYPVNDDGWYYPLIRKID